MLKSAILLTQNTDKKIVRIYLASVLIRDKIKFDVLLAFC